MKTCTKCGVEKELDRFFFDPRGRDGRVARCKDCCNARTAAWRAENPARCTELAHSWYLRNTAKVAARKQREYKANPERFAAWSAAWQKANKEKCLQLAAEWRKANRTKCNARALQWAKNNPEKANARNARRRADQILATPAWANQVAIGEFYSFAASKAKLTGIPQHVDHIVPLRSKLVCGLHTDYNLQVLPGAENVRKGNRHWPDMPEQRI